MDSVHIFRMTSKKLTNVRYPAKAFSSFSLLKDYVRGEFYMPEHKEPLNKWFIDLVVKGTTRHDPFGPTLDIKEYTLSVESLTVDA